MLDCYSLDVNRRESVAVTGDNGSGKTSLFRALFAENAWISGEIYWQGRRVDHLRPTVASGESSWVRQHRPIFSGLTVDESLYAVASGSSRRARLAQMEEVFSRIPELKPLRVRHVDTLSGGERALSALGIGIINRPILLCLDEMGANLDWQRQGRVRQIINDYVTDHNAGCLIVEHVSRLLDGIVTHTFQVHMKELVPLEEEA